MRRLSRPTGIGDRGRPGLAALLVACLSAALTGCSTYQPPSITIDEPRITETTHEAVAVTFPIRLSNPNAEPIELRQFEYTLQINGRKAYHGRRATQTTLHRNGETSVNIPAVIPFDRLDWSADNRPPRAAYRLRGTLLYVTPGELAQTLLDTGVRRPTITFSSKGELNLHTSESAAPDAP